MIIHITTGEQWRKAQTEGEYTTPSLKTDGFIHCSTPMQTADTANMFFKGQRGLVLLCIDENKLTSACRYEDPAGGVHRYSHSGNLFPHIYGPIPVSAVIKAVDFPSNENGLFALPQDLIF